MKICQFKEGGKQCTRELGPRVQRWCPIHRQIVRDAQLTKAQKRWLKRREAHVATAHLFYRNKVTKWARTHPDKAVEIWKRRFPDESVPAELLALKPLSQLRVVPDEALLST